MKYIEVTPALFEGLSAVEAVKLQMEVDAHNDKVRHAARFDAMIGQPTSWRTATHHTCGILETVYADHIVVSQGRWVEETGAWDAFTKTGQASKCFLTPPDQLQIVMLTGLIDASVLPVLPKAKSS